MSAALALSCAGDAKRREQLRRAPLAGFDFAELAGPARTELRVFFVGKAPARPIGPDELRIAGGRRIRDIRVLGAELLRPDRADADDCLRVWLDRPGDSSEYRLEIVAMDAQGRPTDGPPADFDPRYACAHFRFAAECPSDLDCAEDKRCEPELPDEPVVDYLARDFSSLRRLLLDRLALLMPQWRERHLPDLGVTLVELLAYVGDQLSYFQDAVATEAYLDTCRQRISLRRHLRLIDYHLHEGCNARAWVCLGGIGQPLLSVDPRAFYFIALPPKVPAGRVLDDDAVATLNPAPALFFEPLLAPGVEQIELRQAHELIRFYTWGGSSCWLHAGATAATLLDAVDDKAGPLHLQPGDVLVFEELLGPRSGEKADADPEHRHAVRLTQVAHAQDPLTGARLLEITWCAADALPFTLCLSTTTDAPDCRTVEDVSVARGNVLLVDHGRRRRDDLGAVPVAALRARCEDECHGAEQQLEAGRFGPALPRPDVTHAQPLPPWGADAACASACTQASAAALPLQDPRLALPQVRLTAYPPAPDGRPAFGPADLADPAALAYAIALAAPTDGAGPAPDAASPAAWLRSQLVPDDCAAIDAWNGDAADPPLPSALRERLLALLAGLITTWEPRADLLASGPLDRHFVAEIDDERRVWLRFGDGDCGRRPAAGTGFEAHYRVGQGTQGEIGADRLTQLVWRGKVPSGLALTARNPLPARGAAEPEPAEEARLRAPRQLRTRLERAITPADYAAIVERDFAAEVQRAAAQLRADGGPGAEVLVAVDALGADAAPPALLCRIERHLQRYRRIGHRLRIEAARRVPLLLDLFVCVQPGHVRVQVKAALRQALGRGLLPGGRPAFFHPDALSFGEPVALSRIVAAAQGVPGVASVQARRLERLGDGAHGEIESGTLGLGVMEVAQLDDDPDFPEHGRLLITLEGGR